jgi:hypothetical protein
MRYTKCAPLDDYNKHSPNGQTATTPLLNGLKQGAIFGALGAGIGALLGGPALALLIGLIAFNFAFIDGFCDQWLNWRLICIQASTCAMGRVANIETVDKKFQGSAFEGPIEYLFDNDLSFNMRMMPFNGRQNGTWEFEWDDLNTKYDLDTIINAGFPSGDLLAAGKALGKAFKGYEGDKRGDHPGGRWTMHCEIEGNGMQTLCTIGKVLAALGPVGVVIAAAVVAVAVAISAAKKTYDAVSKACKKACKIPIFCDILCFVAAAVAAVVAGIVGFFVGLVIGLIPGVGPLLAAGALGLLFRQNGDWKDVQNDPESGNIERNDCVIVMGDEVYDAGHEEGWAEIHPVIHLQKTCATEALIDGSDLCCIGELTKSAFYTDKLEKEKFKQKVKTTWAEWCKAVKEGYNPTVIKTQARAEHIWFVHPLVDGCAVGDKPPPIR